MASPKTLKRNINLSPNASMLNISRNEERKFSYFETINLNNLSNYYQKDESYFKKKVDKLNLRFYIETDKYISLKSDMEKSQDNLFLLLFKQISVYIEEVERLNIRLKEKLDQEKFNKILMEECVKKENLEKEIDSYKHSVRQLEKQILETKQNEEKLKKENESIKRQLIHYKDHLNFELSSRHNYMLKTKFIEKLKGNNSNNTNLTKKSKNGETTFDYGILFKTDNLQKESSNIMNSTIKTVNTFKTINNSFMGNNSILETTKEIHNKLNISAVFSPRNKMRDISPGRKNCEFPETYHVKAIKPLRRINNTNENFKSIPENNLKKLGKNELEKKGPTTYNTNYAERRRQYAANLTLNSSIQNLKNSSIVKKKERKGDKNLIIHGNYKRNNNRLIEKTTYLNEAISHQIVSIDNENGEIDKNFSSILPNNSYESFQFKDLFSRNLEEELKLLENEEKFLIGLKNELIENKIENCEIQENSGVFSYDGFNNDI